MNRAEIKEMMDRKERMDMVKKIAAIRNGIEETRRIDTHGERWLRVSAITQSYKKYCRESWLYRVLEFIGLR